FRLPNIRADARLSWRRMGPSDLRQGFLAHSLPIETFPMTQSAAADALGKPGAELSAGSRPAEQDSSTLLSEKRPRRAHASGRGANPSGRPQKTPAGRNNAAPSALVARALWL